MNETQVDGTESDGVQLSNAQADEVQTDDTQDGEVTDDETLADGHGSVELDRMRRIRLNGFLRELVRQEGRVEAAELLGVAYRTVVRAEKSGEITGRMGDALERLLGTGDDPEVARLRERVGALEKELRDGLDGIRAAVSGRPAAGGNGDGQPRDEDGDDDGTETRAQGEREDDSEKQAEDARDGDGAGRSETGAAPQAVRLRPTNPDTLRPLDPEIVTVEPADDDVEVYGDAWPLVEEWRRLRVDHPGQGRSLLWLTTEERLLVLELEMLEEHGLTLPPEKQPLRGFGRRGQSTHRRTALDDTRRALRRRRLMRWVMPWLWREEGLEPSQGPVSGGC